MVIFYSKSALQKDRFVEGNAVMYHFLTPLPPSLMPHFILNPKSRHFDDSMVTYSQNTTSFVIGGFV